MENQKHTPEQKEYIIRMYNKRDNFTDRYKSLPKDRINERILILDLMIAYNDLLDKYERKV